MRLSLGDAHPAAWLAAHLRILQLPPAKKTDVFLVDTTGTVYPDDPRKKTCCAKLCMFLNAALSILTGGRPYEVIRTTAATRDGS